MNSAGATIVVTLDIGGSAAKASGYDVAHQVSLGSVAVPYPAAAPDQDQGTFDPEGWWQAAVGALQRVRELIGGPAGRFLGITVSAIRIPFVLLGADGNTVMPGLLNRDRRAAAQVADVVDRVGADWLYRTTGHWPAPEFGLPKLLWVRDTYPEAWQATSAVLQLHDWFLYRLSGVLASERSSAAMSQLIDVRAGTWAAELLAALNIPAALLPGLRAAGELAGPLLPAVARATGFAQGTPVHIGDGDTHVSALSIQAPATMADYSASPVVVAGTTAPALAAVPTAALPGQPGAVFPLLASEHVVPGITALEANAGPTGMIADQLRGLPQQAGQTLASELEQRGVTICEGDEDELVVLAGNPFFGPAGWESVPPPTVIGLRAQHGGDDVYAAALRGTCYAIQSVLDCLVQHSGLQSGPVIATGGMSRNTSWAQLLADSVGEPILVPPADRIAGRAGAAIVTGTQGQLTSGTQDTQGWRTFTPNPDLAGAHTLMATRYQEIYRAAQERNQLRLVTSARPR